MPKDGDSAFHVARSIFNSDVWSGDPHMAKIWIYLLGKAKFKKNSPEQGTLTTSLRRIQQDNSYLDPGGIIKRFWSIHKIVNMLEDLEKKERIICKGTPKGTLINIVKYGDYQDLSNYKGHPKGNKRDTGGTLACQDSNKNDTSRAPKNVKNVKEIHNLFEFWNSLRITVHKNIDNFKPNLNASLKIYSEDEIKDAMKNYANIVHSKDYYWDHKYKLDNFLSRKGNIDRFLSVNKPWENWLVNKKQEETTPPYLE